MSTESLRESLLARKAEIEAALRDLDRIEALAAGAFIPANSRPSASNPPRDKSNSQKVVEAIAGEPKSLIQLAVQLDLKADQVYHALTSHRLRKIVKTVTVNGQKMYGLKSTIDGTANGIKPPKTLVGAILELLDERGGEPMQTSAITEALQGIVTSTAANFRGTVASTLSDLVKAGRIRRAPGKGYFVVQRQIFN